MSSSCATPAGTARFAARFPGHSSNQFYRQSQEWTVASLGLGSYLGEMNAATDAAYTSSTLAAVRGGINFIDTSLNYRNQRSERSIGAALGELFSSGEAARDEMVVCTKAGYLVPGATPAIDRAEVAGGMHCLTPAFLVDQLERSLVNLRCESIDVFYLHNPESQLSHVAPEDFYSRIRRAFAALEEQASAGKIRYYGAATWNGFRTRDAAAEGLSLTRLHALAREVGGDAHRFRFIQLPLNLSMQEAASLHRERMDGAQVSTLAAASRLGISVVASASLLQSRLAKSLPAGMAAKLPGAATDAQRAIQFTRSTPGIAVALVGMSNPKHVEENLGVAGFAPADLSAWFRQTQ